MAQVPTLKLSPRIRTRQAMSQWIERGILASGQPLPSERTLGAQLGVSQTVVRHVLTELFADGLIVEDTRGKRTVRVDSDTVKASNVEILQSTIALLTSHSEPTDNHQQPGWIEHMTQGAIVASRAAGRDVLVIQPERMAAGGVGRLLSAPPLGVVMLEASGPGPDLWLHRLAAAGIPVVVYGDSPDPADFDRVISDHEGGTYELTRWVITQGRRQIVNMSGKPGDQYWYQTRLRGYERAMREADLQPRPPVLFASIDDLLPSRLTPSRTKFDIERHELAGYLLPLLSGSDPVDAIMLGNDGVASVTAAALRLLGREPGRDVLLVGYDNIWAECVGRQWEPAVPAATVDKCNSQIGQELVRLLMDRVEGRLPKEPQRRVVPSRLIVLEQDKAAGVLAGSKDFG